jgi:hypothetical protein
MPRGSCRLHSEPHGPSMLTNGYTSKGNPFVTPDRQSCAADVVTVAPETQKTRAPPWRRVGPSVVKKNAANLRYRIERATW